MTIMDHGEQLLATLHRASGHRAEPDEPNASAIRAVAWARVSTTMQDERGLSIPEQFAEIEKHAERQGITIIERFHEAASAYQREEKRVEFHRMLDYLRDHRDVSVILIHEFSRFSRKGDQASALLSELRRAGVRVISTTEGELDDDTAAGVWMKFITLAKNEAFSRDIAFHTKKGCKANVKARDPETGWCYKNGGQPPFGYKGVRLVRGEEKKGRPIFKTIWMPDDTIVNGRQVHEWARDCLLMVAQGASLAQLRDYCNANGIPAPRTRGGWQANTWSCLLKPTALMKFTGWEVYNVHAKHGRINPQEEWVFVERAHPALISVEEAEAIAAARAGRSVPRFDRHSRGSRTSDYLLSGGLFTCGRCGSNMVSHVNDGKTRYRCGTQNRGKAFRCGSGVTVQRDALEQEVWVGLREWLGECLNTDGMVPLINKEYRALWETASGYDPLAARKLADLDRKIGNLRLAYEEEADEDERGYIRQRLQTLKGEREDLASRMTVAGNPPQVDAEKARVFQADIVEVVQAHGTPEERKMLVRECVESVVLYPDQLKVQITYQIPAGAMKHNGPGALGTGAECNRSGSGGGRLGGREH